MRVFDLGAWGYDTMTRQVWWSNQVGTVETFLPVGRPVRWVLDLGCGPGGSAFALADLLGADVEITGIDISERMLERARIRQAALHPELTSVRFLHADATQLDFPDDSFDLAVGHSFLYLVPDRLGVLREVRRVLAPGGTLVCMEPRAAGSLLKASAHALRRPRRWLGHPVQSGMFAMSMALWRVSSGIAGRMTPELGTRLLQEGGFHDVRAVPTLAGLGLHLAGTA